MEHVVFFSAADGTPAFRRFPSLEEAVALVEELHNSGAGGDCTLHALTEIPLAVKTVIKIEVPGLAPAAGAAPAAAPVAEEAPAAEPQADDQDQEPVAVDGGAGEGDAADAVTEAATDAPTEAEAGAEEEPAADDEPAELVEEAPEPVVETVPEPVVLSVVEQPGPLEDVPVPSVDDAAPADAAAADATADAVEPAVAAVPAPAGDASDRGGEEVPALAPEEVPALAPELAAVPLRPSPAAKSLGFFAN